MAEGLTPASGAHAAGAGVGIVRAILALPFAIGGTGLILLHRDSIFGMLVPLAGIGGRSDVVLDSGFRIAIYGPVLLLGLLGLALFRVRPRTGAGGLKTRAAALATGVGAVVLLIGIAWATGVARPAARSFPGGSAWLLGAGTLLILLQVAAEELLFRGLLQPLLARVWGGAIAVAVAALGFAAVHFAGGWRDPISLVNIVLAGAWFGLLAWRTGGLAASVMAHFGYNWSEEMLFGASPNPGRGAFGSIVDLDLSGPAIWGGSVEGLNASVVLSLVLVLLIAPLLKQNASPDAIRRGAVAPT